MMDAWWGSGVVSVELTCGRAELYACIDVLHGFLSQPMLFSLSHISFV